MLIIFAIKTLISLCFYFHSSLNMEDISEIDYRHVLKVFNKFNIKDLGEYHDLYVQGVLYY